MLSRKCGFYPLVEIIELEAPMARFAGKVNYMLPMIDFIGIRAGLGDVLPTPLQSRSGRSHACFA